MIINTTILPLYIYFILYIIYAPSSIRFQSGRFLPARFMVLYQSSWNDYFNSTASTSKEARGEDNERE